MKITKKKGQKSQRGDRAPFCGEKKNPSGEKKKRTSKKGKRQRPFARRGDRFGKKKRAGIFPEKKRFPYLRRAGGETRHQREGKKKTLQTRKKGTQKKGQTNPWGKKRNVEGARGKKKKKGGAFWWGRGGEGTIRGIFRGTLLLKRGGERK